MGVTTLRPLSGETRFDLLDQPQLLLGQGRSFVKPGALLIDRDDHSPDKSALAEGEIGDIGIDL